MKNDVRYRATGQTQQAAPAPIKSYGLSDNQAPRHLLRAGTLLKSGDADAAQTELDLISLASLSTEQRNEFNLLAAQIDLNRGDAENALQRFRLVRPALLSKSDKIAYYQSLAFAYWLTGNVLQGVNSRIKLGELLDQPAEQQANIAAIVDMLGSLPEDALYTQADIDGELAGWVALAKILKQRNQPDTDIDQRIQQWRLDYPKHPANADFLQAYLTAPETGVMADNAQSAEGGREFVAVLLPVSGPYAPAGNAVKAGLQAAYRLAAGAEPRPPLKFYDSAQDDISGLYQQAVSEGAQYIIGPLVKEQIQALVSYGDLSVPVLALNHIENLTESNLYQFGLSPIDEADALAFKAMGDGKQSAWILVPNTAQGQRIGNYLASSWQSRGGVLAGVQSYDPRTHDVAQSFANLVDSSAYSGGPPKAVLLSANDEVARELAPQLKYHQSIDLSVYAMPTIYSGQPKPVQDAELGLFTFCDVPWLFNDYYSGPLSQSALQTSWQGLPDSLIRLVALGIDAYNLLGHLDQLATKPFDGATGRLTLNGENRIVRNLVCAKFTGGVPVATGYAE
ncbi:penicillin-binding protein activator [Methylomonas sp. MgM2]